MATRKPQQPMPVAKAPIPIDELEPINLEELTPVDNGALDVRGGITARRLSPPPTAFGDPTGNPNAGATAAATGLSSLVPGVGILHGALTGDWSIPKAQLSGGVRALKGLAAMVLPQVAPRYSQTLQTAGLPPWLANTLASNPVDPFAMSDRALGMGEGLVDAGARTTAPSRAVFGENRPPTADENMQALEAESELATTLAAPVALGPATLPTRRYLGTTKPSRMMNSLLARGNPQGIVEALDRGMDRATYRKIDPREPGVSNPGLTNLDEIGAVGDARAGAFKTRTMLDDIHAQTQDVLQNEFGHVQIPMQELTSAIRDPIVRRLRNVQDGVAPGSVNTLTEFLQKHQDRFMRQTGGRSDPATINAYKRELYELLNDADFKKMVGDDPSLHGIMREQASALREIVDRYTTDPSSGISPVAELNRKYGDMRPALDAWEGLIIGKETQGARSGGTITPSSLDPSQMAQVPVRRGLFGALGEAWNAPWRVTTTANMLRSLAPPIPRRLPPMLPAPASPTLQQPQGLLPAAPVVPPAPQAGPGLPAANVPPQRALPPATGATPQFAIEPPVFPVPPVSPLRLPPAPIDMLPDNAGVWQRGPLNVGESGGLSTLPVRGEQTITPTRLGVTPSAPAPAPTPTPTPTPSPSEVVFGSPAAPRLSIAAAPSIDELVTAAGNAQGQARATTPPASAPALPSASSGTIDATTPSAALDVNRNAIAPKRMPQPDTPATRAADIDYASMAPAELDVRLEMAVRARDNAKRMGAGSQAIRALDQRIADIHAAIAKPMQPEGPMRLAPVAKPKAKKGVAAPTTAAPASSIAAAPETPAPASSTTRARTPAIPDDATVQLPDGTRAEIDRVIEVGVGDEARTTYVVKGKKYSADQLKVIPKRVSAMRNGQYIDGVKTRTFQTRNGKALILRADDGSERMVFESEVRA